MSQIIPFESAKLPTKFAGMFQLEKLGGVSGGYPIISIKGKIFTRVAGDDREIIKKPGEDDPASSIEVVILKQNPHLSKVYYTGNYTEGSDEKPLCYSNNGLTPEADAQQPQAKNCSTCARNVWGSRITENGGKGKECSDSRRIAVAPLGLLNDPMLIRIPAASLKAIDQYGDSLVKRQVPYQLVVTRIGFDYTVAHPALTFKALGMVDESSANEVVETLNGSLVDRIIGLLPSEHAVAATPSAPVENIPTEPVVAPVAAKPKPAPVVEPTPEPVVEAAPEPVAKPKAAIAVEVSGDLQSEIENALSGLDFDDED